MSVATHGAGASRIELECAITDLHGDVLLLDLARDGFVEGGFPTAVLQDERVTTLLHAIDRLVGADRVVQDRFYEGAA